MEVTLNLENFIAEVTCMDCEFETVGGRVDQLLSQCG